MEIEAFNIHRRRSFKMPIYIWHEIESGKKVRCTGMACFITSFRFARRECVLFASVHQYSSISRVFFSLLLRVPHIICIFLWVCVQGVQLHKTLPSNSSVNIPLRRLHEHRARERHNLSMCAVYAVYRLHFLFHLFEEEKKISSFLLLLFSELRFFFSLSHKTSSSALVAKRTAALLALVVQCT